VQSIVSSYVTQFLQLATASTGDHLTLNVWNLPSTFLTMLTPSLQYGNDSSWGLTYNLWAEKLLGFNIFPASMYTMQAVS
jgi:hypothetical protein